MRIPSSLTTWTPPAIIVVGFLATAELAMRLPAISRGVIGVMAVIIPALIAALCIRANRHAGPAVAAALAITPTFLTAGAYGLFLVVDNDVARTAVLVSAAALCSFYFTYLRGMQDGDARFQEEDFLHLSFVTHVVTLFFVLAAVFGVSGFTPVATPVASLCVAVVVLCTSVETFRRAGVLASGAAFAFAFALVAAESVVALSFLPTSGTVNAAVGTVLYATGLHFATWSLSGRADVRTSRRHLALSFFLVALVLSTARWS